MPDAGRRSERSRRAILDAARELLATTAYGDLTVEAVAARAGVGKQTIYRWWGGRGAVILGAVIVDALAETSAEVVLPDTGDLRADLAAVLRATVAEFAEPRTSATTRALTIETLGDERLAAEVRDRILRPQLDAVRERLRSGQRAGQVRAGADLDLAVELLFGPIHYRWMLGLGPLTDSYADAIVASAMAALEP